MAEEKPNILVVDDTEAICSALRDLLTMNGYAVRTAPSGERAMQILENAKMDLIITDLKMSGMSGLDLLKKVKQTMPNLPVIILTGFGDMDSVIAAMRAGVADYLKKPFSVNEVLEVVKRELKKLQFIAPPAPVVSAAGEPAPGAEKPPRLYIFSPGDLGQIEKALTELRAQISADSVLLLEEAGYVIAAKGTFSDSELPSLTTLIVSGRKAMAQLARMLGEEQSFALNYLEGQRVGVYTAGLGEGLFLVLVVPKHIKQGAVWLYAKKAANDIEKVAARALEKVAQTRPAAAPAPSKEELRHELATQTENVFRKELAAEAAPAAPVQTLTFEQAMSRGLMGDMVNMMAQAAQTEPAQPKPEQAAAPEMPAEQPVQVMSFEEAMKLGLLGGLTQEPAPPPPPAEPTATMSFEEALKMGLLGGAGEAAGQPAAPEPSPQPQAPPPQEQPADKADKFLSFEEALQQGLLGKIEPGQT